MKNDLVTILKALGDENRIKIFRILKDQGERCACDLLEDLDIVQSTLSHHMKILVTSGLVNVSKKGKWMNYTISQDVCKETRELIFDLFDGSCCK